jgi:signal transduction histidine kinase
MNIILIVSIMTRLVALGWSIVLLLRLKDWRLGFFTALTGLMALRQILTLGEGRTDPTTELPGLIVSVMVLVAMIIFERMLVERKRAHENTQRSLDQLRIVTDIERAVGSTLELRAVFNILMEKILDLTPRSVATIRLLNNDGSLERTACRNMDEDGWRNRPWHVDAKLGRTIIETRSPLIVENVRQDSRTKDIAFFEKHGFYSCLAVPLIAKEKLLGILSLYTREEHHFAEKEVELFTTLGRQAAIAIYNSQLYEQTKAQALALDAANKTKEEFLSVISHELRTPLNAIIGFSGMMNEGMMGEVTPAQQKALTRIDRHAQNLFKMVGGVLQVTSLQAHAARVVRSRVNLSALMAELRDICDVPMDQAITLQWNVPDDLPFLDTDGEKLRHILQNLVINAIKFTNKGTVTVSVRHDVEENNIDFTVADTGIGIAPADLPVIFEMFRQVDSSETRPYSGMGVGLYIVKNYTELLGGAVAVESWPGRGSTFKVTIPLNPR